MAERVIDQHDARGQATAGRSTTALKVRSLRVSTRRHTLVRGLDLTVPTGGRLGIVGESGSGKSLFVRAVLDALPTNLIWSGSVEVGAHVLGELTPSQRRQALAASVAYIPQDPLRALDPRLKIGSQIENALRLAHSSPGARRDSRVANSHELLDRTGFADPDAVLRSFPHQLSGGMAQRVVIALSLVRRPLLILADEPTTALDVTTQARVLNLISDLAEELSAALVLISHDLELIAEHCSQVIVMKDGQIVESAPSHSLMSAPQQEATRKLVEARAELRTVLEPSASEARILAPSMRLQGLTKVFRARGPAWKGADRRVTALDRLDLELNLSKPIGIVGESGSGKTTLARLLAGLEKPTGGVIERVGWPRHASGSDQSVQMVFQDAFGSLNPAQTVWANIEEGLRIGPKRIGRAEREERISGLMAEMELPDRVRECYPKELSGGQRQRVAIARALIVRPMLLIADEPVSALDMHVQASVLAALRKAGERHDVGLLLISHDLQVIRRMVDEVLVFYRGVLVERGSTAQIFATPSHPYTRLLLASTPGTPWLGGGSDTLRTIQREFDDWSTNTAPQSSKTVVADHD